MARFQRFSSVLFLAFATVFVATSASADAGDENWDPSFGSPGVTGNVQATVVFEGDLVIGGNFTAVGGLAVENLARWDGTQWTALGEPFNEEVMSLVVWDGALYAGGAFTAAGATSLGGLARWDGAGWVDVGGGVDAGAVDDLMVWNNELVIAGSFYGVDGGATSVGNIAIWDGNAWNDLNEGTNGPVYDVEVYGGSLYACGEFSITDGVLTYNLARWSGTAWFAVGGGLLDADGDPSNATGYALAVHGGRIVIGGQFQRAGSLSMDGITAWNGTTFSALGTPSFSGEVTALGNYGADLVASGGFGFVGRWNGFFWASLGSSDGGAYTFAERAGELILGGAFNTLNGVAVTGLARYAGAWSSLVDGQGASGIVESFHDWSGTMVVGGRFSRTGNVPGLIAAWDGAAWTPLGSGIPRTSGAYVGAMTTFENDLIVGGSFTSAGGVSVNKIARWNGTQWSAMGAGSLGGVSGLQVLDGTLYANGYWSGEQTLGRWNGNDFEPLGTGVNGGVQILYCLGAYQGDPVMGGGFTSVNGVAANNIARWTGTAWQPLAAGTSGAVFAIHETGGLLYVGGVFTQAGGVPALNVAVWDGASWSALGAGVNGRVFGIRSIGADLFVTGEFTLAGGLPSRYVARWDGSSWHPLGSGLDAEGHVLERLGDSLWVGGEFTLAGQTGSARIARWTPPTSTSSPAIAGATRIAMRPAFPNPSTGATVLAFELPRAADVTIDVFDVRGARVRTFIRTGLSAGPYGIAWDGCDSAGLPAPSGVYFIALRDGLSSARQKVVLVR